MFQFYSYNILKLQKFPSYPKSMLQMYITSPNVHYICVCVCMCVYVCMSTHSLVDVRANKDETDTFVSEGFSYTIFVTTQ